MSEEEYSRLQAFAKLKRMPVGEWVRRVLGRAMNDESIKPADQKLKALQSGLACQHPAPDIQQMNREIEEGYLRDLH